MAVDLHIHTTASDGTYSPAEVVRRAKRLGFKAIAITDHDTVEGIREAQEEGKRIGLEVLAGIELNTDYENTEIHILGYLFNLDDRDFLGTLEKLKEARDMRVRQIVQKLQNLGLDITIDRVLELAGTGTVGRPHVARVLIEKGYVQTIRQAFDQYIGPTGPGYVSRYKLSPVDGIKMIKDAGGIPVLAHPGIVDRDELVEEFIQAGLLGIEAFHSDHSTTKSNHYSKIAQLKGLVVTGGSDCHGPVFKGKSLLGRIRIPYLNVVQLKEAKDKLSKER